MQARFSACSSRGSPWLRHGMQWWTSLGAGWDAPAQVASKPTAAHWATQGAAQLLQLRTSQAPALLMRHRRQQAMTCTGAQPDEGCAACTAPSMQARTAPVYPVPRHMCAPNDVLAREEWHMQQGTWQYVQHTSTALFRHSGGQSETPSLTLYSSPSLTRPEARSRCTVVHAWLLEYSTCAHSCPQL